VGKNKNSDWSQLEQICLILAKFEKIGEIALSASKYYEHFTRALSKREYPLRKFSPHLAR